MRRNDEEPAKSLAGASSLLHKAGLPAKEAEKSMNTQLPVPYPPEPPRQPQLPLKMGSERMVVSAPLSYSGSARRLWNATEFSRWVRWTVGILLVLLAWTFVTAWYIVIFGLFGILVIPFRLLRRSHRKRRVEDARHRELLAQMQRGQQSTLG